jgi:hypothetical protein
VYEASKLQLLDGEPLKVSYAQAMVPAVEAPGAYNGRPDDRYGAHARKDIGPLTMHAKNTKTVDAGLQGTNCRLYQKVKPQMPTAHHSTRKVMISRVSVFIVVLV